MFGTILGGLPVPDGRPGERAIDLDDAVAAVLAAQEQAGLEPLTDGQLRWPGLVSMIAGLSGIGRTASGDLVVAGEVRWEHPLTLEAWAFAASRSDRLVKQQLPGPYTLVERLGPSTSAPPEHQALALSFADALRQEILALRAAGCQVVEVEEPEAVGIGTDVRRRSCFAAAHRRLTEGIDGIHLALAVGGGNADGAGIETILAGAYSSLAVDLIAGPDNWRLVATTPGDRGVVCGVIEAREGTEDGPEIPLWASRYAASTRGRGIARVGLGSASGLDRLPWAVAARKIAALGEAARVAGLQPGDELAGSVDPRSIDIRAAAFGNAAARHAARRRAQSGSGGS
jgi:methionine synthase II (cobalamin-independent)